MFTTISHYIWGDIENNYKISGQENNDKVREHDWVMLENDEPIIWSSSVSHQISCPSYPLTSSTLVHKVEKSNLSNNIESEKFPSLSCHSTKSFPDNKITTVVLHCNLADKLPSQSSSVSHQVHHSNLSKNVDHPTTKIPFQKKKSSLSICYHSPLSICYNVDISLPSPLPVYYNTPLSICYKDDIFTNIFKPCKSALSPAFATYTMSSDTNIMKVKYEPRKEATSSTYLLGSMPVQSFLSSPKKYRNKLQRKKTSVMGKPVSRYAIANIKMYYNNVKLCI